MCVFEIGIINCREGMSLTMKLMRGILLSLLEFIKSMLEFIKSMLGFLLSLLEFPVKVLSNLLGCLPYVLLGKSQGILL